MDFDVSEASLRVDMAAKNENFKQKYKDYTRFIGNSSEEAEEPEENVDCGCKSVVHIFLNIHIHIYR